MVRAPTRLLGCDRSPVVVYAASRRPMSGTGADRVRSRERRRPAAGHARHVWRMVAGVGDSDVGASDVRGVGSRARRDVVRPGPLDRTAYPAAGQPRRRGRHQRGPGDSDALRPAPTAGTPRRSHGVRPTQSGTGCQESLKPVGRDGPWRVALRAGPVGVAPWPPLGSVDACSVQASTTVGRGALSNHGVAGSRTTNRRSNGELRRIIGAAEGRAA